MREVRATEAKACLAELLRAVEHGETVAITRHGREIAHLVPAQDRERALRKEAVERFRDWRRNRRSSGLTTEEILEFVREGRRW